MSNQRNLNLDLIKVIAMLGVICLHTTHSYTSPNQISMANIMYESAVVSIPLFFMVSGYLMLGKENANYRYVSIKIGRIIRFVFLMSILLWCMVSIYHSFDFDVSSFFEMFLGAFIQHGRWGVLWYLGAMIIIYLLLPLLNKLYQCHSAFLTTTIIIALIAHLVFINNLLPADNKNLDFGLFQTFRLYNWLLYFLIGGLIKRYRNFNIHSFIVLGLFALNIFYQFCLNEFLNTSYCEYYYSSFVVTILVTFLFIKLINMKLKYSPYISIFSFLFLPVYVIHIHIISLYNHIDYYFVNYIYPPLLPVFKFLCCSVISIATSYVLMKIPYVKQVFRL